MSRKQRSGRRKRASQIKGTLLITMATVYEDDIVWEPRSTRQIEIFGCQKYTKYSWAITLLKELWETPKPKKI